LADEKPQVEQTLSALTTNCSLESVDDLFSQGLSALLAQMQETYENWNRYSPDRFVFDILVRRSTHAIDDDQWEEVLMIVACNINHEKDLELRIDMLALVEHLLCTKELHDRLTFYTDIVLKMILIPAAEWKIGKPNTKIRKAAIICMMKLVQEKIVSPEKLSPHFLPVLAVLKNCLDDDWDNGIRFSSIVLLKYIVTYIGKEFTDDENKDIYEQLLKRLDDSQDGIRIETCKVFEAFFDNLHHEWSSSLYEYSVK
jgi:hypothetical protein